MSLASGAKLLTVAVAFCAVQALAGCGAIVPNAPFRAHPDVADRADYLGPYDGKAIDSASGQPIAGARVLAAWSFRRGIGLTGPEYSRAVETTTNSEGRYLIPVYEAPPGGLSTVLDVFTLVIYKRGYVAYRSDRIFDPPGPRLNFTQRLNVARLERWRPELSHAAHLTFMGGLGELRRAARWEARAAAAELDRGPEQITKVVPKPVAPQNLDVSGILSVPEVRQLTGSRGDFDVLRLTDQPVTPIYDSLHFKAKGLDERYDLAIRTWKVGPEDLEPQYKALAERLPGARKVNRIGDESLESKEGEILAVAFLARNAGFVVSITCGTRLCRDHRVLEKVGKRVLANLGSSKGGGAAEQPVRPSPAPTEPAPTPTTEEPPTPFQLRPPEPRLGPAPPATRVPSP